MKSWLLTFSPEGRNSERKTVLVKSSFQEVNRSTEALALWENRDFEGNNAVRPRRIMTSLCPEKVMLESFVQSKTLLPGYREISL